MVTLQQTHWKEWEIVGVLGNGSYGAVYRIRRNICGVWEEAALKVISLPRDPHELDELYDSGYSNESITLMLKDQLGAIHQEYLLMHELKGHTNIVCCDDFQYVPQTDTVGWKIFIRMELLTTLSQHLSRHAPEDEALRLGRDMCNTLRLCRKRNIIHRDIKPQNIMVSRDGDYKLGDFGVAKIADRTSGGTKVGTLPFMAPEVYFGQPYGHQADIYSLGIVLYWMLNERKTPFLPLGDQIPGAGVLQDANSRRLSGERLPLPAHGSPELQQVVLKACQFDPRQRYTDAREMLDDLNRIPDTPAVASDSADDPEPTAKPRPGDAPDPPAPPKPSPNVWYVPGDL